MCMYVNIGFTNSYLHSKTLVYAVKLVLISPRVHHSMDDLSQSRWLLACWVIMWLVDLPVGWHHNLCPAVRYEWVVASSWTFGLVEAILFQWCFMLIMIDIYWNTFQHYSNYRVNRWFIISLLLIPCCFPPMSLSTLLYVGYSSACTVCWSCWFHSILLSPIRQDCKKW